MDLIRQCFEEHKGSLTQSLVGAEFSIEQAMIFLPVAALGLSESTRKSSVFQTIACLLSDSHHQLQRIIDVESMARNSGINQIQVTAGLFAIAPVLLKAFANNSTHQLHTYSTPVT